MTHQGFPPGWDEARVKLVLDHYEEQSEDQAIAEDEAAAESESDTLMAVPKSLVPAVRELIAEHRRKAGAGGG